MSFCLFITSNIYMEPIKNPHYKQFSINEAIDFGIEIPEMLIHSKVDPDQPDVILWCDSELILEGNQPFDGDADDNYGLIPMSDIPKPCKKHYGVYIEWNYFTTNRAQEIINYIKNLMTQTEVVEIWHIWLSDAVSPITKTTTLHINDLRPKHIKILNTADLFDKNILGTHCDADVAISYCLKIIK